MTLFPIPHRQTYDYLRPGTHVQVCRGLYWHHAIYVGKGVLIEFGQSIFGGPVGRVAWENFAKNQAVRVVSHPWTFSPEKIVERAESQLGRADFNLVNANCEHFATWCATGRWASQQVQVAMQTVKQVAAATIIIAAMVVVAKHGGKGIA